MKCLFVVLFICIVSPPCLCAKMMPPPIEFNVIDYGAQGDGQTDDSTAFMKAWEAVCSNSSEGTPTLVIPEGNIFMLQPVTFQGPCNSSTISVQLRGTIIAPNTSEAWKWADDNKGGWIKFQWISGLVMDGGGLIDGQGASWWECRSCPRPRALGFHYCENLRVTNLTHFNPPGSHISLSACNGSHISHLNITAPGNSPNTDGIDISRSSNVTIQKSLMATGDDCIAINGGSSLINITSVLCGPGHGISIGSLGRDGSYETVEEIHVQNCTFTNTTNGARIKTWEGGSGYARNITFEDIILIETKNPVIIDQQYGTLNSANAVAVSNVTYRNIRGTSSNNCKNVIQLNCDQNVACTNIVMENINITSITGRQIDVTCHNAEGTCSSCIPNVPCLSQV